MKYHGEPTYYWIINVSDAAFACYFKPGDFGIGDYDYKIKIIGFIGGRTDGPADIYVTSKEKDGVPVCSPDNHWQGAEYGPKSWHINNSYPNYDDCNVYDDNWHYSKHVDKFWCIYHLKTSSPPYPVSDEFGPVENSATWMGTEWVKGALGSWADWCMHCVIVYWGADIESTSLGAVKALFR
ncbi:MAG: hypothetical protein ACUVWP_09675 [bacterium]